MSDNEFSIIERYFSDIGQSPKDCPLDLQLSIGDDAAVINCPAGKQLVLSMDTLVAGVHFPDDATAADIAHKSLAVNLSDLAAMAAQPSWFSLSLTLPKNDQNWLVQFSSSLDQIARQYDIKLIGGDTCKGPLSITIQVGGLVSVGEYIARAGAQQGDLILVSGQLGSAALGLAHLQDKIQLSVDLQAQCIQALNRPNPRLQLNPFLREFAHCAIDLSDGLQGDLAHILKASSCGAIIQQPLLPVVDWIRQNNAFEYALSGGDDYEICCCVSPKYATQIEAWNQQSSDCHLTKIGEIVDSGFMLEDTGQRIDLSERGGFCHFS